MPTQPQSSRPDTVIFFATCLIDLFYPKAGLAGIRLLEREGLTVMFPPDQTCCGQPAYNSGYIEEARDVARRQLDILGGTAPIIVPSGSCAGMMRHHYPRLFANTPDAERARATAERVYELTEFLVTVLQVRLTDLGPPLRVAWHGSCSSVREMGIVAEPKRLIGDLAQVELVPLARERECCGFGGAFAVRQADVSAAMVADKAADVEATGAAMLVSGDCGCLMNIGGRLAKAGSGIASRHIAEFLWERTDDGQS